MGRCIYCGDDSPKLTLEHIVPESLGGLWELPEASCPACQKIINGYEHTIGRVMFGDFRIKHGIKSKRPLSKRPTTIDITKRNETGTESDIVVSRSEWPAPLFMYKFGQCSIIRGLRFGTGIFEWFPYVIVNEDEMKEFHSKHGDILYTMRTVPVQFARMLAKIGHCVAIADLGIGSFEPIHQNIDAILCRTEDVAFTVGGDMDLQPKIPGLGHITQAQCWKIPFRKPLIVVEIRLFAALDTPNFHVAVGTLDLQNPQHLITMNEKMPNASVIKIP